MKHSNSKQYQQSLITIAYLCAGLPLLLFGWLFLEVSHGNVEPKVGEVRLYFGITVAFMLLIVFVGIHFFRQLNAKARSQEVLTDKLAVYRNAVLLRMLSYAAASLVVIAAMYVTAEEFFSALYAIMIVLFSINNPSLPGIAKDLKLTGTQRSDFLKNREFGEGGMSGDELR